jgi:hypothetical protein
VRKTGLVAPRFSLFDSLLFMGRPHDNDPERKGESGPPLPVLREG